MEIIAESIEDSSLKDITGHSLSKMKHLSHDDIIIKVIQETKLDTKEEFSIIKDKVFINRNKSLIKHILSSFPRLDTDQVVCLLKFFFLKQLTTKEMLNLFMLTSQVIIHVKFYQSELFGTRTPNDLSTERFFSLIQNSKWNFYITSYKTRKGPLEVNEIFYTDDRDRRRKLYLDDRDFFNYICLRCEEDCNMERECPFSHNDNEYNYHPLYYKVIPCERMDSCLKESCPNAHKDDMRIIYNVNNPIIKRLECLLNSSLSSMDIVPNFTFNSYKLSLPAEFDPRTYKTFPCPLEDFCLLDSKLCLNYHGLLERRRSLAEIKYSSNPCQYASYDNKWKAVTENECRDGDKCLYSHSIYERLYHPDVFKKSLCKFEEKNKKCEYVLICPFYHKHDVNNNGVIANVIAIVKFHKKNLLKGIKIQQGKIESYKKILSSHQCGICHSFLAYSYNELDCGSRCILCKDCTERFREMNKCLKCNTDYSKVQEFRIKTKN